jgi:hemerythrin-like domain-containing protein
MNTAVRTDRPNIDRAVAVWHAEHKRFAKLLDFLDREIAAFAAGGQPDYALMRDVIHYLRHYADRFHHPREDEAFARLVKREPDLELAVNRLVQEHRVIAAAGEALLECLQDVMNDIVIGRKTLEVAAATYLVYYRHHLATEESDILPRAERLLTAQDWAAVAAAVQAADDPLFGKNVGAQYRALRMQIDRS